MRPDQSLRPTHEFQPSAGSLPTPSGSSRPSTAGNAASKKAPARDMIIKRKVKLGSAYAPESRAFFLKHLAAAPLYVPQLRSNRVHTVNARLQMTPAPPAHYCYCVWRSYHVLRITPRLVLKHEQNAITVSAKQSCKSLPVLTTPLMQAWASSRLCMFDEVAGFL